MSEKRVYGPHMSNLSMDRMPICHQAFAHCTTSAQGPCIQVEDDEAVARVVAAERHGLTPRLVQRSEIECGTFIGEGGEGKVLRAKFQGKSVALKIISLKGTQVGTMHAY